MSTFSSAAAGPRSVASVASTVDTALAQWAAAERAAGAEAEAAPMAMVPGSRAQLEAEVVRLRRELAAARRGTTVSERVDKELRRVKRLWQESEHRLLLLQNELRTAQVTQRTLAADLTQAEVLTTAQGSRIEELVSAASVQSGMMRERAEELEVANTAITHKTVLIGQLQLQLVATAVSAEALSSEVQLLERASADQQEDAAGLLEKLHASASERAEQHRTQLALWETRASSLIEAGPAAKLDLVLMNGNASLFEQANLLFSSLSLGAFLVALPWPPLLTLGLTSRPPLALLEQFRSLIKEQRANCEQEAAMLRGWVVRSDGRARKDWQAQLEEMRRQLSDVQHAREQLRSTFHAEEVSSAVAKVQQAERAIAQLEAQLTEERRWSSPPHPPLVSRPHPPLASLLLTLAWPLSERRLAVAREKAAAKAAEAHREAVALAVEELQKAAAEMDGGLSRVVDMEVEAVRTLQHQEAFRARTAKLLLLQRHRPTLAKCYRAWRAETAKNAGTKLMGQGAAEAIAQLKHRSLTVALAGGVAGSMVSEYTAATLSAVEDEWARREAQERLRQQALVDEVAASKALAGSAIKESEEQRSRLDRQASLLPSSFSLGLPSSPSLPWALRFLWQAAALATEAEEMRRGLQAAQRRERAAAAELDQLKARMAKTASGGHVDAARLGLERDSAQREVAELRAMLAAAESRHAAELAASRAQLTEAEGKRLEHQAVLAARARELADVRRSAGEEQQVMVAAAQIEAGRQVERAEEARQALDEALQKEAHARREDAAAHRKREDEAGAELAALRRQLDDEYKPRLMEARIELEATRAELSGLREGLRLVEGGDSFLSKYSAASARHGARHGSPNVTAVGVPVFGLSDELAKESAGDTRHGSRSASKGRGPHRERSTHRTSSSASGPTRRRSSRASRDETG